MHGAKKHGDGGGNLFQIVDIMKQPINVQKMYKLYINHSRNNYT